MKILAIEKEIPGIADEELRPYLNPEAAMVWELYQSGIVREMYFRQDRHGAVLMLECASIDEANRALATLPLVKANLIAFDIMALSPYSGFSRLFEKRTPT